MNESAHQPVGLIGLFSLILKRDLLIALRRPGQWLNPLLFFVIVITLYPLGIGPDADTLRDIAPGLLWVSALLAVMLSLESLFASEFRDGTLEQWVLSGQPMSVIALAKVAAHWVLTGLPLLLLTPLLAVFLQLPGNATVVLVLSLLLGTFVLSVIGAIGAALTVGLNQSGVLLSLLVLPLTIPVLIFGTGAVIRAGASLDASGHLAFLGALLALALALGPLAIAASLRVGISGD